jgi:uncharacterized protein (DUF4415 family)
LELEGLIIFVPCRALLSSVLNNSTQSTPRSQRIHRDVLEFLNEEGAGFQSIIEGYSLIPGM